ncbi:condensin complex subunit 2 [Jatropha curcas]|uniref:condensin complex subunit 2 n=1 Tax=Jatropha curcas TaxID=180498 RepID=UPI001893B70F|nr:condensin complex subunit 2 [Jatropha curcas]
MNKKINEKNTRELKLIDHLSEIIKVETQQGDTETNFQKASFGGINRAGLEAVHSEAYKVLGGINRGGLEDEQEVITEADNVSRQQDGRHSKKESEKKISPLSTLESSFEALNVKKFDVAIAVDPLYHQTSAQFGEGGAKSFLLNNLGVCGGCQLLFDSFEVPGKYKPCSQQNDILDMIDIAFAKESLAQLVMNILAKDEICPTLRDIICHFDEDDQRSSEAFSVEQKFDVTVEICNTNEVELENSSFGNYEAGTFSHDDEASIFNGSFTCDSTLPRHKEENEICTSSEPDIDQSFENVTMFLFQGLGINSKQNRWAGPDDWKFHKQGPEYVCAAESDQHLQLRERRAKVKQIWILIS